MAKWLSRGIAFAALVVVIRLVQGALFDRYETQAQIISVSLLVAFAILVFVWGYVDGRTDARANPDPDRRDRLALRWLLAGLVAGLLSGAVSWLISLTYSSLYVGDLIIELTTFAVPTALQIFLVGFLGVAIGRWLVGGVAVSDAVPDIKSVILPLRLIFWGALIVLIDLTFSRTENGVGWRFDFLNDAVGMLMIVWATARLAKIRVSNPYRTAMLFVTITAVLSLLDAIHSHFIYDTAPAVSLLSSLVGVASMIAMVVFCVAMRWLSEAAGLARAARSWKITTWLMVVIYLVPIGGLSLAAAIAIARGSPFNIELGPKGLLLVPVFCIPLIYFFVSISRMKADAQSPSFEPPHPQVGPEPGRTGQRPRVVILAVAGVLVVVGAVLLAMVLSNHGPAPKFAVTATVRVDNAPYTVAVDPNTHTVYVPNTKDNTVSVIDGNTNSVTATVFVGDYPTSAAVDPTTRTVYVTNAGDDTVSVIDGNTNTVTATVDVGGNPKGVAVDPGTHTVYVANANHPWTVSVMDGKTNTVTATVEVRGFPNGVPIGMAVDPETHTVYVANDDTVSVIDGKTHTVTDTVDVDGYPLGVAVDPGTHTVYVTNSGERAGMVSVIDGKTHAVTATVDVGNFPISVAVDPGTRTVYVVNPNDDTVSVIDGSTNTVTATVDVGQWPAGVAVDPGTHTVYVTNNSDDTVSVIERP